MELWKVRAESCFLTLCGSHPYLLLWRNCWYDCLTVEPRDNLGRGASFAVEGASLNISNALNHLRYRSIDTARVQNGAHFNDHTETKWAYNTEVAFKASSRRATRVAEILIELRVLCHPPLQRHPNIVRLLGITWTKDQPRNTSELGEDLMEWPMVAIERAPHGSLRDFLGSHVYNRVRSSLQAKLRLCVDVLKGIAVSEDVPISSDPVCSHMF